MIFIFKSFNIQNMWQAWFFLFIGFVLMFGMTFILEPKLHTSSSSFASIIRKKREKMNFPSNHISTSLMTPDNSPYSSCTITPIVSSYRNSPVSLSNSIFSHELSDTTSNHRHYDE